MSRLRIEHSTVYTYREPVGFGRHRLVLRPREGHDLQVESITLNITPAHNLSWARDVHSNSIAIVDFLEETERLSVHSVVTVHRATHPQRQDQVEPRRVGLPIEYDELESTISTAYQTLSYPDDADTVRAWLDQLPELKQSTDAEAMLMTLCTLINQQIKYQRRMAKGVQSPSQTLTFASGSCRDMAVLMMDAARTMGLSARFASGYLDCPASEAGRASMHAWTEIYLPILGWRGFDPTLGEETSLKHIVVGVSHHPRGVMPISGMFRGAATTFIDMVAQVKIERIPS